jgi:hypothetical protein
MRSCQSFLITVAQSFQKMGIEDELSQEYVKEKLPPMRPAMQYGSSTRGIGHVCLYVMQVKD